MIPLHELGGDGPPLLISHATGFAGRLYGPLAEELAPHFTVWAVDHRGHGDAGRPVDDDMSYEAMADDLLDVVDGMGDRRPNVLGHSMGATIALLAERRRPGTFRAAYVYEPAVVPESYAIDGRMRAWVEAVRNRRDHFDSPSQALSFFASREPYRRFRADALKAYVDHGLQPAPDGGVQLRCRPADEAACYERNRFTAESLGDLTLPVAIAYGGGDAFGVGLVPPPLATALPAAPMTVHPALGHFGPLEAPGTIAWDAIRALSSEDATAPLSRRPAA